MIDLSKYPKFQRDLKLPKKLAFLEIEWRRACPDVDLQDQAGWAYYWLTTNSKAKDYKDMVKFLSNWFKRCQLDIDKMKVSGFSPRPVSKKYREPAPEGEVMTGEDFRKMREAI